MSAISWPSPRLMQTPNVRVTDSGPAITPSSTVLYSPLDKASVTSPRIELFRLALLCPLSNSITMLPCTAGLKNLRMNQMFPVKGLFRCVRVVNIIVHDLHWAYPQDHTGNITKFRLTTPGSIPLLHYFCLCLLYQKVHLASFLLPLKPNHILPLCAIILREIRVVLILAW